MRLTVIGHSYVTPFAQEKYVAMKRQAAGVRLQILTPPSVGHVFMRYEHARHPGLSPDEVQAIPALFQKHHMTYMLDPRRFWSALKRFNPTHIHIEEDPHSLVGAETVTLARFACAGARLSFFVWDNLGRRRPGPFGALKTALTRYSLRQADLVVCGNREAEELLVTRKGFRGVTAVLPQVGLDPGEYARPIAPQIRDELPERADEPVIGFVGRLVPEKGLTMLLETLAALEHLRWRAVVIGDGPLRGEMQGRWQRFFGKRLVYRGPVAHREVPDWLRCLDIFVLPSYGTVSWREQFGLTLAQAMMAGVACVGSSSGAIPEVLGDAGLVFNEGDRAGLLRAVELLIRDPGLRASLGAAARAEAQRFTNEAISRRYLDLFNADVSRAPALHRSKSGVA